MSPTFKCENGYRFGIFSNEENRMHVHVYKENNSAKIWLEPLVELADNKGFQEKELSKIIQTVIENEEEFKSKYRAHIR
ncbi:MAG: DUF4160 domain-containing protein [Tannerella sp.]|jgi:RNAse (barnase) inhibitor barstar|nr:DUF4160 domain-containing protein [Tannerella sp.]